MELVLLADHPASAEKVARWYFEQWGSAVPGRTLEQVIAKVSRCVSRETAPMLVLARDGGEIVGAAELKTHEMDIFPDYEFWIGGVYVDESRRGQGIASLLVSEVLSRAKDAGIKQLHLQTEDLSGGLYARHGFEPIEEVTYKGNRVLVMVAATGA